MKKTEEIEPNFGIYEIADDMQEINLDSEILNYIQSISENPESVFDDIQKMMNETTKDYFETILNIWIQFVKTQNISSFPPETIKFLTLRIQKNYKNCCEILATVVLYQLKAIEYYELDIHKAYQIIAKRATEWYPPTLFERNNLPIPYSKAVVAIAQMSSKGKKADKITNALTITENEVQLFLEGFNKLSGTLGISTHKLLVAGLASFADTNHVGLTEKRIEMLNSLEYTVSIPEKEYALLCGYDVEERPTNTTTELSKEKKRIKIELDNFRKQAKKDLNILSHARISWTELIKKKPRNFENVAIIGTNGIKNGYIKMTFDSEFIKYILQIPVLMQYSTAILSIDNRKATAYVIGLKMSEHYHMLQNHKKGTANRLKVKTLLECTDLQTIEEIRKSRSSWIDRIKEPFENALDELFQKGVISDWNYCKAKGMLLTDIEAQNIPDFETWSELNLSYELKNPADLTRLIEQKETAIEDFKADKKKKAGRPKKETDNPPTTTPKRKRGRPKKTES